MLASACVVFDARQDRTQTSSTSSAQSTPHGTGAPGATGATGATPSASGSQDAGAKYDGLVRELAACAANTDSAKRLEAFDTLARRLGVSARVDGGWSVSTSVSPIDDSKTVLLGLPSERQIAGGPKGTVQPQLVLRCKQNKVDAYVITGLQAKAEKPESKASATVRFDKQKAVDVQMDRSTDGDSLFWPDSAAVADKALHAERLVFQFTPVDAAPLIIEFDLRGIAVVYPQLKEACENAK
jgi:hypothetical protein